MMTDFRALCAELLDEVVARPLILDRELIARARAALAKADEPAVPEGREPAAVTGQPSDEELLKLAQQYSVVYLLSDGSACHPFQEGYDMRNDVLNFARAVLARWGNPAPRPLANGTEEQVWPLSVADGCHEAAISAVTGSPEQQLLANAGNTIDNLWNELEREGWALRRLHRLQQENARFREPERTILCDILANGTLLPDPDGKRYGVQPVDGEVAELVTWLQEIGETIKPRHLAEHQRYKRAAELLERQALVPVPVSERLPGPEDMTDDGEVWIEDPGHEYPLADAGDYDWDPHKWILRPIGKFDAQNGLRWLPAHALPLPEVGE